MFIDLTHQLKDNPAHLHYGVCVTDVDGDGQFEIFVAGHGFPNRVLKWDGEFYLDVAPSLLRDERRRSIGVAAADIDGDGREELYVMTADTFAGRKRYADRLFDDNGFRWADLFALASNRGSANLVAGRSVMALDRRMGGCYGFFIANYGGPMRLYEMDEDGFINDIAEEAGLNMMSGGRALALLPLISGEMGIFAGNESGPNFLFREAGDGSYTDIAEKVGVADVHENVRGVAVLDANENGSFDLAYGNWEGPHRLFVQHKRGHWRDAAPPAMAAPSRVRTVIAADFNNDGYEELFFNNIDQPNRLFGRKDGVWQELPCGAALEPHGLGTGAAVGDFNEDGRLELLIAHGETGLQPLSLYQARDEGHGWLRVLPLTQFGAPARGALITLETSARTQQRVIDAGSGYLCQMEPVAHFGLGQQREVIQVEVRWPDGVTVTIEEPEINRLLTVEYPG